MEAHQSQLDGDDFFSRTDWNILYNTKAGLH